MSKKDLLNAIEVKNPCSENWNEMQGNEKVRFCSHCAKDVNNISEMTRKEARLLLRRSEGRLCIRYIPDPNTRKPLFTDNLYKITRRAPGLAAGVMTASITLSTAAYAQDIPPAPEGYPAIIERTLVPLRAATTDTPARRRTARLYGTIVDANGSVVPGHPASLIDLKTDEILSATSNEEGLYEFTGVPSGKYKLIFPGDRGFRQKTFDNLEVSRDDNIRYNVSLDVGSMMGVVVVTRDTPLRNELSIAVEDGDVEKVIDLISRHANVNAKEKDRYGVTPLFLAVENGNVEIAEILLRFGSKVNARDKQRQTPLMRIDDDTPPELVDLLLKYGARLDLEDREGYTVLMHAADRSVNASVVRTIILAGADVNHKNREGETAWDMADSEVEELLESFGGRSGDPEETGDGPDEVSSSDRR